MEEVKSKKRERRETREPNPSNPEAIYEYDRSCAVLFCTVR